MTTTKKTTRKAKTFTVKTTPDLPKNPFIFEILHLASKQRSKAKKIEVLKKYDHKALRILFVWNFDETVISVLPEGEVPYSGYDEQNTYTGGLSGKISHEVRTMHDTGSFSLGASDQQGHTTIRRECKHFFNFVKYGNNSMKALRRESMFINILEGLHPLEAEILILVKDKKLSEKYKITKEIVSEAFPDIHWGGRS